MHIPVILNKHFLMHAKYVFRLYKHNYVITLMTSLEETNQPHNIILIF